MKMFRSRKKQQGAALVIGLILLVVITVLAISGMNTATTELAMARNDQNYENAFQAAETGLEQALGQGSFNTLAGASITQTINANDSVTARIEFEDSTIVPDKARRISSRSFVRVGLRAARELAGQIEDQLATSS